MMKKVTIGLVLLLGVHLPAMGGAYFTMVLNLTPNPATCQAFTHSGALYMAVNPGQPASIAGNSRAFVNSNHTVALLDVKPGVTTILPALKEDIFCEVQCALARRHCRKACSFAVDNFNASQRPNYAMPNGTIFVRCPTLDMSKFPRGTYSNYPYTKYPYSR